MNADQQIGYSLLFLVVFFTLVGVSECNGNRQCVKETLERFATPISAGDAASVVEAARKACY